jgi:hypothetical protein
LQVQAEEEAWRILKVYIITFSQNGKLPENFSFDDIALDESTRTGPGVDWNGNGSVSFIF